LRCLAGFICGSNTPILDIFWDSLCIDLFENLMVAIFVGMSIEDKVCTINRWCSAPNYLRLL
jgi:hypothetical protein